MVEEKKFRYTYAYTASSYPNYRENFVCLLCDLNNGYSITFVSRKEMLKHLHEHVKAGHVVPEEEFEKYMWIEMVEKKEADKLKPGWFCNSKGFYWRGDDPALSYLPW